MSDATRRLRAVWMIDTPADYRFLEGLAARCDLTVLMPSGLADRPVNFWDEVDVGESVEMVDLGVGRRRFILAAARYLWRRRRDFDVVFVMDNLSAALGATLARRAGGPTVVIQQGRPTLEYVQAQRGGRPWWRQALLEAAAWSLIQWNERTADGVGTVSEHVRRDVAKRNPRARMIPAYGVDPEVFAPRWTRRQAQEMLGLPSDAPIVMYRSRIAPEKDPDAFVDAIALLRERGRQITALYMGGEIDEFRSFSDPAGVEVLAGKPANRDELAVWYVAADVVVQTSKAEGLGLSPVEALACGTPIVVTDTGGLPEVADGGRAGILTPLGDAVAVADGIARLLDDPDLAARQVAAGRDLAATRFEATAALDDWVAYGTELDDARRGRRAPGRPPRVLFFDHETRLSGGERDLVDLVRGLPDGIDCHVVIPAEGPLADQAREAGATVHLLEMPARLRAASRWDLARRPDQAVRLLGSYAGVVRRLRQLVRDIDPDVVHTQTMKAHLIASTPGAVAGRPLVWRVCDVLEAGWLKQAMDRLGSRVPDRVVCISEAVATQFRGTAVEPVVEVVHCGVRIDPGTAAEAAEWRARFGASDDQRLVAMVGQIAHWKGHDVFVEAAAKLAARRDDVVFGVSGDCLFPENESEFDQAIRDRVAEAGIDDRFRFIGGRVDRIGPLMASLDVLVHASRLPEPFGRVLVEAMAAGTPPIASARGAAPEIVDDSSGVIIEPDDADVLAAAIESLLDDEDRLARLSDGARRRAPRFDISPMAAGMLSVYRAAQPGAAWPDRL